MRNHIWLVYNVFYDYSFSKRLLGIRLIWFIAAAISEFFTNKWSYISPYHPNQLAQWFRQTQTIFKEQWFVDSLMPKYAVNLHSLYCKRIENDEHMLSVWYKLHNTFKTYVHSIVTKTPPHEIHFETINSYRINEQRQPVNMHFSYR